MKKILSLLLALCLLAGLSGCFFAENNQSAQAAPTAESVPDGTTLPLFWPPLPEETTQPSQPPEQTQPEDRPTEPVATTPQVTEPTDPEPTTPKPTTPKPTEPVATEPTEPETEPTQPPTTKPAAGYIDPNGTYDSKKDVALYIHLYGRLPSNYITKKQAKALGWSGNGNDPIPGGKCIGGDRFYNNEGLLPKGHTYYECDIDTLGRSSRGAKRIVYSLDGLVYYTSNHYRSFTLLYGDP